MEELCDSISSVRRRVAAIIPQGFVLRKYSRAVMIAGSKLMLVSIPETSCDSDFPPSLS